MREAAVALSCCRATDPPVLLVLPEPPEPEEEYGKTYERFIACSQMRRELLGRLVLEVFDSDTERMQLEQAIRDSLPEEKALQQRLDPYRAWFRRYRRLFDVISANKLERVLCLAELPWAELQPMATGGAMRARGERTRLLPDACLSAWRKPPGCAQPCCLENQPCAACCDHLADTAWRFFHGDTAIPAHRQPWIDNDVVALLPELLRALRLGVPLQIVRAPSNDYRQVGFEPEPSGSGPDHLPPEAVLVEVENDASLLLAVLYAHKHHARLVCFAAPDPTAMQDALRRAEQFQQDRATARSKGNFGPPIGVHLLAKGRAWLDKIRYPPLADLEQCVARAVPAAAVEHVGAAPLTAITRGTPYHFVRHGAIDWRRKPIGHVMGEPYLILQRELHRQPQPDVAALDVLFDPGAFPDETLGIAKALAGRPAPPIFLTGDASNADALRDLCRLLPVELIYLNSHGTHEGVELAHGLVPRVKIGQSLFVNDFMNTVVINNSCLSWQGMGQEFVRCGAGAYVGTLWSVDAHEAATYAARVVARLTGNTPVASAVASERDAGMTAAAYIMVGTLRAHLPQRAQAHNLAAPLELAAALFDAAHDFASRQEFPHLPALQLLVEQFTRYADDFVAGASQSANPALHIALAAALMKKSNLLLQLSTHRHLAAADALLARAQALCTSQAAPAADAAGLKTLKIDIARLQARVAGARNSPDKVREIYARFDSMADDEPGHGAVFAEMSDFFKRRGDLEQALRLAQRAVTAASHERDSSERMRATALSLGRLVQLRIKFKQLDQAKVDAKRGLALAVQLDDEYEQFEYSSDLGRIALMERAWDEALRRVSACISLALRSQSIKQHLNALGLQAMIEIRRENWQAALTVAHDGFKRANKLRLPEMAADFAMDLAYIFDAKDMRDAARGYVEVAHAAFVALGHQAKATLAAQLLRRLTSTE
ncbi:MAG: hypothetical protein JWP59_1794 [Massilia sp.]|nr:hypothetical protein [Massilia sp.]